MMWGQLHSQKASEIQLMRCLAGKGKVNQSRNHKVSPFMTKCLKFHRQNFHKQLYYK